MFLSRKSILVSKAPNQFPSCWFHDPEENDNSQTPPPSYDLEATKASMDFTTKLCNTIKNVNSEEDEWETKILKYGWSPRHIKLYNQVVKILDYDRLARLANVDNKRFEAVQRRAAIDKSADRMRKILATVSWDTQLVQWIHGLMMEFLPPTYLAAYIDIMQTLKNKLPSLVDKMIFWKPGNVNQDLLAPILKRPWQPALNNKYRKLPGNALLVVIPSAAPRLTQQSSRIQKLYTLFTTMAPMLPVQLPINSIAAQKQSLQTVAEQTVSITRTKIQELKAENPDRRLILIGMNSAAAVALQVALVEQVSGIICFGFSCNTVHGVRGQADDHFLELTTPTLFLVGQNAARSNEEEIETFREKITAPTSMVVVGSGDDFLRISKKKRRLEGVTQEMVDNMIVDEISDFSTKCLQRPQPKPKVIVNTSMVNSSTGGIRKRKVSGEGIKGVAMKTQKLMRPTSTTGISGNPDDVLDIAIQSILPDEISVKPTMQKFVTTNRIMPGSRMKVVHPQQQQFSTLKQQPNQAKFITISGVQKSQKTFVPLQRTSRPSTPTHFTVNSRQPTKKIPVTLQQHQQSFSPTKYTIVRATGSSSTFVTESTDLTGTNIFDMPIVFADSEGNIDDENAAMSDSGSVISIASDSPPRKVVLKSAPTQPTFTVTKNKNILIQKPAAGKMFMINGTVIGKQVSANNIVLPKQPMPQFRMQKAMTGTKFQMTPSTPGVRKIEILNNTIIKPAMSNVTKSQASSFINIADAKPMTRLSLPIATTSKGNQIIIKTNSLKPYTGAQILPSIGTKQLGNLTVKRLNVVPSVTKVFKKN